MESEILQPSCSYEGPSVPYMLIWGNRREPPLILELCPTYWATNWLWKANGRGAFSPRQKGRFSPSSLPSNKYSIDEDTIHFAPLACQTRLSVILVLTEKHIFWAGEIIIGVRSLLCIQPTQVWSLPPRVPLVYLQEWSMSIESEVSPKHCQAWPQTSKQTNKNKINKTFLITVGGIVAPHKHYSSIFPSLGF